MIASHIFVDTNILVYAHDVDAAAKHAAARQKVKQFWEQDVAPSISIQVLQELYVNLIRKGPTPRAAREIVTDYLSWTVIPNDEHVLTEAMRLAERYRISFWDASILAAAKKAGATVIWSEDFAHGQTYDGIRAENPL